MQVSAGSQVPADARHTVVEGSFASDGQTLLAPVQNSGASQVPAAARQTVVAGAKPVATQTGAPPVQLMAPTSQGLPVLHEAPCTQAAQVPLALQASPACGPGQQVASSRQ